MDLTRSQTRVLEIIDSNGGKDVPTAVIAHHVYGNFFNSINMMMVSATRVLEDLHRMQLVHKNYSIEYDDDIWTLNV